jgi:hypothetical protein
MATIERRISASGTERFRARVRLRGNRFTSKTFDRKTDARKWAQRVEVAIRQDQYDIHAISRRKTLGDRIDRYCMEVLPRKPKTAPYQKRQLDFWRKELGHLLIADVKPARIAEARQNLLSTPGARGRQRGGATSNRWTGKEKIAGMGGQVPSASTGREACRQVPCRRRSCALWRSLS